MSRNVSSIEEMATEANALFDSLAKESDRGLALFAVEFLSDALGARLLESWKNRDEVPRQLFKYALRDFSPRIDLAYSEGLIDATNRDDFQRVQKIRNEFAHSRRPLAFTDGKIPGLCGELRAWRIWSEGKFTADSVWKPFLAHHSEPRARFLMTSFWLLHVALGLRSMSFSMRPDGSIFTLPGAQHWEQSGRDLKDYPHWPGLPPAKD